MSLHCPALLAISLKLGGYPCCLGPHTGNWCPLGSSLAAHTRPCPLSTTHSTLGSRLCQDWLGALEDTVENTVALGRFLGSCPHLTTPNDLCWSVNSEASQVKSECSLPPHTDKEAAFFLPLGWKICFCFEVTLVYYAMHHTCVQHCISTSVCTTAYSSSNI